MYINVDIYTKFFLAFFLYICDVELIEGIYQNTSMYTVYVLILSIYLWKQY